MPFSEEFCERADYYYDQRADRIAERERSLIMNGCPDCHSTNLTYGGWRVHCFDCGHNYDLTDLLKKIEESQKANLALVASCEYLAAKLRKETDSES